MHTRVGGSRGQGPSVEHSAGKGTTGQEAKEHLLGWWGPNTGSRAPRDDGEGDRPAWHKDSFQGP